MSIYDYCELLVEIWSTYFRQLASHMSCSVAVTPNFSLVCLPLSISLSLECGIPVHVMHFRPSCNKYQAVEPQPEHEPWIALVIETQRGGIWLEWCCYGWYVHHRISAPCSSRWNYLQDFGTRGMSFPDTWSRRHTSVLDNFSEVLEPQSRWWTSPGVYLDPATAPGIPHIQVSFPRKQVVHLFYIKCGIGWLPSLLPCPRWQTPHLRSTVCSSKVVPICFPEHYDAKVNFLGDARMHKISTIIVDSTMIDIRPDLQRKIWVWR